MKKITYLLLTLILLGCRPTTVQNTSFSKLKLKKFGSSEFAKHLIASDKQKNEVIFIVDERTEFFRTIFNLAAADQIDEKMQPCETLYYKEIKEYFKPYLDHPLLTYLLNNDNVRIDFSALALMYKNFESFEFDIFYFKDLNHLGLSEKDLNELRPLLQDFYQRTNFKKFFLEHQDYYKNAITKLQAEAEKEQLFEQIESFYQSNRKGLRFIVFVELTNNANNKALSFYEHNNPDIRALVLTNLCDNIQNPTDKNTILTLDNDKRNILCHEISHIFTTNLLERYIGKLSDFKSICKDCNDEKIKDFIDHQIVYPLQAILVKKLNNDLSGEVYFETKCTDIRREVYKRLKQYDPKGNIPFETVYRECMEIIRKEAMKNKN